LNHPGSGTIDLWFTTSIGTGAGAILTIGAGIPTHVLDMFCFGYPTDGALLNSSSSSLLPVSLAFDSISGSFCSSDFSWYSDHFLLM